MKRFLSATFICLSVFSMTSDAQEPENFYNEQEDHEQVEHLEQEPEFDDVGNWMHNVGNAMLSNLTGNPMENLARGTAQHDADKKNYNAQKAEQRRTVTYVRPYMRRDGTPVRGHYRTYRYYSKPRQY